VTQEDGLIKVVTSFDDTPAAKAGVLSGDVITAIDGSPTQGLTINQVVEKTRGAITSTVKLKIVRGPKQEVKEFTIVRDRIPVGGGEELLALFVEPQTRKWVAWTPAGYYMASAGGEDLIGWQVNRGWNQEADFFPASQFRAQYNRPDIVRLVLQTRDEAEAVRRANAASARTVEAKPIAAALPPVVSIFSPADGSHFSGDSVEIAYSLRSPSGLTVDGLDVLVDGQPTPATGFEKTNSPETPGKVTATLPRKDTKVSLIAHSGDLTSAPMMVSLKYDGPSATPNPTPSAANLLKPKLYALLVGVTGYQNRDYDTLQFPARDAESLAEALEAQKGGLYSDVEIKNVDDPAKPREDPTRPNVVDGLYWLQRAATSRDISMIFLSGHGIRDGKQNFWFMTRDADITRLRATAISNDDLLDLIAGIPGKKVLFIDACHAGAAMPGIKATASDVAPDMNKLVNDFSTAGSGLVVYSASMGTELSHEDAKWDRHGAFAEALIEAIGQGKAKIDQSGRITTDILDIYLEERVKVLTDGAQHPVMNRPALIPDFPLALAKP
jgi:Caspase domain/PDZ domain